MAAGRFTIATASLPRDDPSSRPRTDVEALATRLGAEVRSASPAFRGRSRRGDRAAAGMSAFRIGATAHCSAVLSTSEVVGLPLAAGLLAGRHRVPHVMVAHKLYAPNRLRLTRIGILMRYVDRVVVVSSAQAALLSANLPVRQREKVRFVPHSVDACFFAPAPPVEGAYILAVGLELRDYATLVPALAAVGCPARILASSTWAPKGTRWWQDPLPIGVQTIGPVSYPELRDLYASARFVVLPLIPTVQAAGATSALEAMAMGKAVVTSDVPGIRDYVRHGVTGLLVTAESAGAMAEAIAHLWQHPDEATELGRAGRQVARETMSIERYVQRVTGILSELGVDDPNREQGLDHVTR